MWHPNGQPAGPAMNGYRNGAEYPNSAAYANGTTYHNGAGHPGVPGYPIQAPGLQAVPPASPQQGSPQQAQPPAAQPAASAQTSGQPQLLHQPQAVAQQLMTQPQPGYALPQAQPPSAGQVAQPQPGYALPVPQAQPPQPVVPRLATGAPAPGPQVSQQQVAQLFAQAPMPQDLAAMGLAPADGMPAAPAQPVDASPAASATVATAPLATAPAAPPVPGAPVTTPPAPEPPSVRVAPLPPPRPAHAATPPPLSVSALIDSTPAGTAVRGRRAARKPRLAMSAVFADLVDMADIPRSAYAVDDEVTGAMCLFKTDGGYEVFSCAEDARHEVRFFEDEEAAYFYLFGVLAAEALRNGRLKPTRK